MPDPSPRRQETRSRLLDAAIEVFAEEGLQGASVESICARAGFSRGAFYSNFSSKEELFLALLQREFEQRATHLEQRARELEPVLREQPGCLSPAEAARYVGEFFSPAHDETTWFILQTEFELLAMRDPALAPGYHEFADSFYASISDVVEQVVAAAGRRFLLPVEYAIPLLQSVYDRALRAAALGAHDAPGRFDALGDRIAELLFAITEESEPPS
ncbi:TetR/AcrR family transcriptional regulator [Leucobacter massiliensis]|uniref:TetR family transcriptional regulator n=1 Tax=Leucobacter massiliensis TaxID=1686285 RepID=A0A2S9QNH4_9MICO|nr:TetR/AcrR family transcriptional regulator [Leucobacter massiliensis]PRI11141.1 TetR family transcriptional regulator [Leucobacter massiliensis]